MHVEVSVALNFVISYLYNKLPRRRVDVFGEELEKGLKKKFEGHWYPEKPFKGSAFRCIRVSGENMDPVMVNAAKDCGLDIEEIKDYLPKDLTIWIDPCEVSYRIGEKGVVKILFNDKKPTEDPESVDTEVQAASRGFNPEAQSFKPIDSLSASMTNLNLSPASPTPQTTGWRTSPTSPSNLLSAPFAGKSSSTPNFTAASFAQTKFGSTKLKSQAKRPTRLSPTEMMTFPKNRSPVHQMGFPSPGAPSPRSRTLSPRDPRKDFIDPQGRMVLAQRPLQLAPGPGVTGSAGDIFSTSQLPAGWGMNDMYSGGRTPIMQGSPSPEGAPALLDSINLTQMPSPQTQLHHLLVANS